MAFDRDSPLRVLRHERRKPIERAVSPCLERRLRRVEEHVTEREDEPALGSLRLQVGKSRLELGAARPSLLGLALGPLRLALGLLGFALQRFRATRELLVAKLRGPIALFECRGLAFTRFEQYSVALGLARRDLLLRMS